MQHALQHKLYLSLNKTNDDKTSNTFYFLGLLYKDFQALSNLIAETSLMTLILSTVFQGLLSTQPSHHQSQYL